MCRNGVVSLSDMYISQLLRYKEKGTGDYTEKLLKKN